MEMNLGKPDYDSINRQTHVLNLHDSFVNGVYNDIQTVFQNWLGGIDEMINNSRPIKILNLEIGPDTQFFSFNYTSTLEKWYGVDEKNIYHVHGKYGRDDSYTGSPMALILTHDAEEEQLRRMMRVAAYKDNVDDLTRVSIRSIMQQLVSHKKDVNNRILQNEAVFDKYADMDEVICMGFSFNAIDMPYINKILQVNRDPYNLQWIVYYYDPKDKIEFWDRLAELGTTNIKMLPYEINN